MNLAKGTVRSCINCFRVAPKPVTAIMGDLPSSRVHGVSPFNVTGIDYAGPFNVKDRKGLLV